MVCHQEDGEGGASIFLVFSSIPSIPSIPSISSIPSIPMITKKANTRECHEVLASMVMISRLSAKSYLPLAAVAFADSLSIVLRWNT